jgi:2-oxoacid:acceptor oxidoreductase delta subunit (pyruvate/2-ketoisovalerate family)
MRQKVKKYERPKNISDYPYTPAFESGHLVSINAGWRTFKPVIDLDKCVGCLQCYLLCPDGVIGRTDDNKVDIDYDYCKGCGVCEQVCKLNAIEMKKEDK